MAWILAGCSAPQPPPTAPATEEVAAAAEPAPPAPTLPAYDYAKCVEPLPLEWTPTGEGRGGLKHAEAQVPDLDGDGKPERFTVEQDAGSGFAGVVLRLEPTASDPIEHDQMFSYNDMVHTIPVPKALQGPDRAAWRAPFEQELLRLRCPQPDPSLTWLQTGASDWISGPPVMPRMYGLYDPEREEWVLYSGHTHTMWPPEVSQWPIEDEVRGTEHLLRTLHGVALYDADRDAHRWLYISAHGYGKLRWRTVALAGFEGDSVIIEREARIEDTLPQAIAVSLSTGAVGPVPETPEAPSR